MKNFLLISLFLLPLIHLQSQITIDQSDMPSENDTLRVSVTTNIPGDYALTGTDMTWDFSGLTRMTMQVDTFVSVLNTPNLYWFTFIPGVVSNLASPANNLPSFPGIPFSEFFTFFMNSTASFADNGFAFQISGLPITLKYNNPDIYYKFPCSMGNTWSSNSFASLSLAGLAYFSTQRTRTSQVDGWGTLITPFGSFQTIRIKSELTERDSVFLDTLSMGIPVTRNITEYKWLGKGQGIPLLQINEEGPAVTAIYRDNTYPAGIKELQKEEIKIFPNPSNGLCSINKGEMRFPANLQIVNSQGMVVTGKEIPSSTGNTISLNLSSLPAGIYLVRLVNNEMIKTGKILIVK